MVTVKLKYLDVVEVTIKQLKDRIKEYEQKIDSEVQVRRSLRQRGSLRQRQRLSLYSPSL